MRKTVETVWRFLGLASVTRLKPAVNESSTTLVDRMVVLKASQAKPSLGSRVLVHQRRQFPRRNLLVSSTRKV